VRHEADGEAEQLLDLGGVPVVADRVGSDVLEHCCGVRALPQGAAGAGDSRLAVDDDALRIDDLRDRSKCQEGSRRVAARVRDQLAGGRPELR
jgi:hypothetical protein